MSDRETQLDRLRMMFVTAGPVGLFSGDLRKAGFGNPSQRVEELEEEGWRFREQREPYPSGRGVGKRWWLLSKPAVTLAQAAEAIRAQGPSSPNDIPETCLGGDPAGSRLPAQAAAESRSLSGAGRQLPTPIHGASTAPGVAAAAPTGPPVLPSPSQLADAVDRARQRMQQPAKDGCLFDPDEYRDRGAYRQEAA